MAQSRNIRFGSLSDAENQNELCLSAPRAKLKGNVVEDGLGMEIPDVERERLLPNSRSLHVTANMVL